MINSILSYLNTSVNKADFFLLEYEYGDISQDGKTGVLKLDLNSIQTISNLLDKLCNGSQDWSSLEVRIYLYKIAGTGRITSPYDSKTFYLESTK